MTGHQRQVRPYLAEVRDGDEIDRDAWAKLLDTLLRAADLTPEQAGQPVGPIPVGWRTIRRWLTRETGVSAKGVRDVCRVLNYPPMRALVEVGFFDHSEAGVTAFAPMPKSAGNDLLVRKIGTVLSDDRVPADRRAVLRRLLTVAYEGWADMYGGSKAKRDVVDRGDRPPTRAK